MLDMSAMICIIGKYNCILLSFASAYYSPLTPRLFAHYSPLFLSDVVGRARLIRLWWYVGLGMYYIGTNDTRSNTAPDSNGPSQPAVALNTSANTCHHVIASAQTMFHYVQ